MEYRPCYWELKYKVEITRLEQENYDIQQRLREVLHSIQTIKDIKPRLLNQKGEYQSILSHFKNALDIIFTTASECIKDEK